MPFQNERRRWLAVISIAFLVSPVPAAAQPAELLSAETPASVEKAIGNYDYSRSAFNYKIKCRGCHTARGSETLTDQDYIPSFKDYIGNFLRVPGGREYLVRVPGVYQSNLDDNETADLLNYLLERFGGKTLEKNYQSFSAVEVRRYRESGPIRNPAEHRQALVEIIQEFLGIY